MLRVSKWLTSLLLCGFIPGFMPSAVADQSKTVGDYTIHYSAFTTDTLPQSVARTYDIQRSSHRALLNVAVLKKVMGTTGQPVTARISGNATNLNAQLRRLEFRELGEGEATYYIAVFPVKNDEVLNFSLTVQPDGSNQIIPLEFQQQFFTRPGW